MAKSGKVPDWAIKILMCQEFGKWPWEPLNVSVHDWIVWSTRWAFLRKVMNTPKDQFEDIDG